MISPAVSASVARFQALEPLQPPNRPVPGRFGTTQMPFWAGLAWAVSSTRAPLARLLNPPMFTSPQARLDRLTLSVETTTTGVLVWNEAE